MDEISASPALRSAAVTVLVFAAILVARAVALRAVRRMSLSADSVLRWRAQVRNGTVLLFVLGITVVWAEELRSVALSIVAIAAALVLAMKELIACFMGALLRASGGGFRIGDRIEVAGHRGDVIDAGPLTTSILEVGPGTAIHQRTGRVIVLPNSVLLTSPVINETVTARWVLHVLRVPVRREGWKGERDRLLAIAEELTAPHIGAATETMVRIAMERGLQPPQVHPSVYVEMTDPERLELLLRFPAPVHERGRLAQQILARWLGEAPSSASQMTETDR
jgi:small-conductance mechanosensitive channel